MEKVRDLEAEQAVLGSCIIDNGMIERVTFLKPSDFSDRGHRLMFEGILKAHEAGDVFDMITSSNYVDEKEVPLSYLAEVAKNTPSARNIVAYADIVKDMSNRRKVIKQMQESINALSDKRVNSVQTISALSGDLDDVVASASVGEVLGIDELIDRTMDKMDESNQGIKTGLKTGIPEVDARLGDSYLAFGEITVIGGLSKNGKTLLANTITSRLQLDENEVGHVFSIEMTTDAMFNAIISARTGVPSNFYRKQAYYLENYPGQYQTMMGRWGEAASQLQKSQKLTFDGKKEVNADYICANIKKQAALARRRGKVLRYVIIDHLHRMNFDNGSNPLTYAIRDSVRKIKNTAAEYGIAVVLLAQLNNKAEHDNPTSFHILDSASVRHELQAFVGIRMYRDNGSVYFGIFCDSQRYADAETRHDPAYLKLINGVLTSLPEDDKYWTPPAEEGEKWKSK